MKRSDYYIAVIFCCSNGKISLLIVCCLFRTAKLWFMDLLICCMADGGWRMAGDG
jgi:hypothetical protein